MTHIKNLFSTPETDTAKFINDYGSVCEIVFADFARNLERERNAAINMLEEYSLPYSDEQLSILAACTTGRGKIGPLSAAREIRRRAVIDKKYE